MLGCVGERRASFTANSLSAPKAVSLTKCGEEEEREEEKKTAATNKRPGPVKDVNSKQKQQNFNLTGYYAASETELPLGIRAQWGVQARGI